MKRKNIIRIVIGLIATVVVVFNWDNWFGDLTEPEYRLPGGIQRVMVLPGQDGLHERTFTWVSGERYSLSTFVIESDTLRIESQVDMNYLSTTGGQTKVYHIQIPKLSAGKYTYRIQQWERGEELYTGQLEIPESSAEQNFVLIGDLQDWSAQVAAPFVQSIHDRYPRMDAWLFIGDQIERPHERFWNVFYETIRPIAPSTPIIAIPGNHEYEWGLPFSIGPRWKKTMVYPPNGPSGQVGKSYFIDYPSVRIVCLDTNTLYAHLKGVQNWLRRVLTERTDHPFLIVMGHHGVYSVRSGRTNLLMRHFIRPILEENGVDLVLSGHDHAYARDSEDLTAGQTRQKPVYLTTSSSHKTYAVGDSAKHVVSFTGDRFYQRIRGTADSLYVDTYRSGHHLVDTFAIAK